MPPTDKKRDHVETMIRSCLISSKEGVPLRDFANDYVMMTGQEIPFRELGYPTLHAYLLSIPRVARLSGGGHAITVHGVPNEETATIARLVSDQRSSKKSSRGKRGRPSGRRHLGGSGAGARRTGLATRTPSGRSNSRSSPSALVSSVVRPLLASRAHPGWNSSRPSFVGNRRMPEPSAKPLVDNLAPDDLRRRLGSDLRVTLDRSSQERIVINGPVRNKSPNEVSDAVLETRCLKYLEKYKNGVWFDKLQNDFAKSFGSEGMPRDLLERLRRLTDVVEVEDNLSKPIVKLRRHRSSDASASTAMSSELRRVEFVSPREMINKGFVSFVKDPHEWFLHLADNQLERIQLEVNREEKRTPLVKSSTVLPGAVGAAVWRTEDGGDGHWYRFKVLETDDPRNPRKVRLFFLDFGNISVKTVDELYVLPEKLFLVPAQAVHCKITNVPKPVGGWTLKHVDAFKGALEKKAGLFDHVFVELKDSSGTSPYGGPLCDVDVFYPLDDFRFSSESLSSIFNLKIKGISASSSMLSSLHSPLPSPLPSPQPSSLLPFESIALPLLLPSLDLWDEVFVSDVQTPTDTTIRIKGPKYSDKLTAVENKLNSIYSQDDCEKDLTFSDLESGRVLAAKGEDDDKDDSGRQNWYRARIDKLRSLEKSVECTLVDHGSRLLVKAEDLRRLSPENEILAYQAIKCRLKGFRAEDEELYAEEFYNVLLESLLGKILSARVEERVEIDGELPQVTATFFDEDGRNLNEFLAERAMELTVVEGVAEDRGDEDIDDNDYDDNDDGDKDEESETEEEEDKTRRPELPAVGEKGQYYISFISSDGEVFLQAPSAALDDVIDLMASLAPGLEAAPAEETPPLEDDLCCAKSDDDKQWYRAVVEKGDDDISPSRRRVFFVDYGNTEVVPVSLLRRVAETETSNPLTLLPFQCVKTELHGFPPPGLRWTSGAADRLWELCTGNVEEETVVVETVERPSDDTSSTVSSMSSSSAPSRFPSVRLFVTLKGDGGREPTRLCLNDAMMKELYLFEEIDAVLPSKDDGIAGSECRDAASTSSFIFDDSASGASTRGNEENAASDPGALDVSGPVEKGFLASLNGLTLGDSGVVLPHLPSSPPKSADSLSPLALPFRPRLSATASPPRPITKRPSPPTESPKTSLDVAAPEFVPSAPTPSRPTTPTTRTDAVSASDNLPGFPIDYSSWTWTPAQRAPVKNEEMEVHVLSTWNGPSRFIVSRLGSRRAYLQLEAAMNEFYTNPENVVRSPPTPLPLGGLYVGFFSDFDSWYRFTVKKEEPLHKRKGDTAVIAHLVDYGEISVVPRHLVQPLYLQFRELPYQAYSAELHDLRPPGGGLSWSVEAKEALDDLIVDKDLFAVAADVKFSADIFPRINLTLRLFDTSGDEDVVVAHEMIRRGVAQSRTK